MSTEQGRSIIFNPTINPYLNMVNVKDFTNTTKFKIESPIKPGNRSFGIPMSSVLSDCNRRLWYKFRWADISYINAKQQRIFDRGNLEEQRVVDDLKRIGCNVLYAGENQLRLTSHFGHARGRPDGLIHGLPEYPDEWIMLEIKTSNSTHFNGFIREGIEHNLSYLGQAHIYMHELQRNDGVMLKNKEGKLKKINIKKKYGIINKCLFIVTNKNDEERYYQFIEYDEKIYEQCNENIMAILYSESAPSRIGRAKWYKCDHCDYRSVCHDDKLVPKSCRTCVNVEWHDKGIIKCGLNENSLSIEEQITGCDQYQRIEIK